MTNHGTMVASAFVVFALIGGLMFFAVDALTPPAAPTAPATPVCLTVAASLQNLDYDYATYADDRVPRFLLRTPVGIVSRLSYTTAQQLVERGRASVRRDRDNHLRLCDEGR